MSEEKNTERSISSNSPDCDVGAGHTERSVPHSGLPEGQPIVLDLFSGAGGMSLGFEMAGYHIALGVEKDRLAAQTYAHNFDHRCHTADISEIQDIRNFLQDRGLERVDVIIGGPPCQGFSRVGRGKIRSIRRDPDYIHDPRNQYYEEFLRFVEALHPLYFVMENIPDMQYHRDNDQLLLEKMKLITAKLGYTIDPRILEAHHYGVPQTRKRLFIIGSKLGHRIRWPEKTRENNPVTLWQAISDLPVVSHFHRQDEMRYVPRCDLNEYQRLMRERAGDTLFGHQTRWHNDQDLEAFALLPETSPWTRQ
jgi:DNA (cytosine-5)-methyltransferase 1